MNAWDTVSFDAAPVAPKESRYIKGEELFYPGTADSAGVLVTEKTAIQLPAVLAALNVLASDVAVLPLNVYRRRRDGGKDHVPDDPRDDLLACSPDEETTAVAWRQAWMFHALTHGTGYREIVRTGRGIPASMHYMDPAPYTRPYRDESGALRYRLSNNKTLPAANVVKLLGLSWNGLEGLNFIRLIKETIGLGLGAQGYTADFYANGSESGGVIETPMELKGDAARNLAESWERKHRGRGNRHKVAVLEQGASYKPTTVDPEKAQLIEARKFQVLETLRPWRVPPHKAGDFSQAHLANIEASNLDYLITALMYWLVSIEQEFNLKLFSRAERMAGYFVEHNVAALLRGDTLSRFNAYGKALADGWMNRDEVRARENMSPIGEEGGGTKYLVQLNQTTLEQIGEDETTEPMADQEAEEQTGEEVTPDDPAGQADDDEPTTESGGEA